MLTATTNEIWWLNSETDAVSIGKYDYYSPYISEDGSSMVYEDDDSIWIMDLNEKSETRMICDDAYKVIGNKDLSHIYIVDGYNIYYLKEDNELETVFKYDGYISISDMAYNEGMNKLFFIYKENLYSVGTSTESLEKVANKVNEVMKFGDGIFYTIDNFLSYEHYYLSDKGAFKIFESLY